MSIIRKVDINYRKLKVDINYWKPKVYINYRKKLLMKIIEAI